MQQHSVIVNTSSICEWVYCDKTAETRIMRFSLKSRDAESTFLWDSWLQLRAFKKFGTPVSGLKSDTDSWTSVTVAVKQTDKFSRFKKNNNPILLQSYLNLISVIACCKTWFGLLRTIHYFIIFCKIVETCSAYADQSPLLAGLRHWLRDLKK